MSKVLELTPEVEKHLIAVFDAALKHSGWPVMPSIEYLRNSFKELPASSEGK